MTKAWRKSSNGPDWIDLRALMIAIGATHSAHVEVTCSPLGIGATGSVKIECAAHFDVLPGSRLPETVVVNATWPSMRLNRMEELAYNLLWQLDREIGKVYQNSTLWEE